VAYWVLRTACRQAAAWERQGRHLRVGINLSPSQFEANDLVGSIAEALKASGLTPRLLDLEVTENILLSDDERAADTFVRLRALGVGISFDDFGTGFGSLSHLKKFPFDRLKIDRSFVREIRKNPDDAAIVASTIGLAKQLGLEVVAEGIEDAAAMDVLIGMGCTEGQGYYFGRPVPAETFEKTWWAPRPAEPLTKPQAA
jgi:EAL domain-containing protein (putative c-di-GMP-specific phosphodiesterase class I)